MSNTLLKVDNLHVYYGSIHAIKGVSFEVNEGEIVTLIGANGAGKSTTLNTIAGLLKPHSGSIMLHDQNIVGVPADKIVSKGMALCPEGRRIFLQMTVLENLEMGAYCRSYTAAQMNEKLEEMYTMFPRLKERLKQKAGSMSGGEQQMLAIARGLMSDPSMVMLDEPSLGLAPVIVDDVFDVIHNINTVKKLPVILVEQNAYMALSISNRCYVLENGRIAHSGKSSELIQSDVIRETYLGG